MSDTIVLLQLEHGTMSKLLSLLETLHQEMLRGEAPDYVLLELVFEYFRDYPEHCHHPKEDAVFRKLQTRAPETASGLRDLLGDHEALERLTALVAEQVEEAKAHPDAAQGPLNDSIRRFVQSYRRHLEDEEAHFFPAVVKTLTRDDWAMIDFAVFDQQDPLYDRLTESRFTELGDRIWSGVTQHV